MSDSKSVAEYIGMKTGTKVAISVIIFFVVFTIIGIVSINSAIYQPICTTVSGTDIGTQTYCVEYNKP